MRARNSQRKARVNKIHSASRVNFLYTPEVVRHRIIIYFTTHDYPRPTKVFNTFLIISVRTTMCARGNAIENCTLSPPQHESQTVSR